MSHTLRLYSCLFIYCIFPSTVLGQSTSDTKTETVSIDSSVADAGISLDASKPAPSGSDADTGETAQWRGSDRLISSLQPLLAEKTAARSQRIGFIFVDPKTDELLVEHQSDDFFHPASNIKLLTSAAALKALGPRFRWQTEFWTKKRVGRSLDSLWVKGGGDPSFSFGDLSTMVERLTQLGINEIRGDLILDASVFEHSGLPPGFSDKRQDGAYRASVAGLNLNWNQIVITLSDTGKKTPHVSVFPPSNYVQITNDSRVRKTVKKVIQIRQTYPSGRQKLRITGHIKTRGKRSFRRRIHQPLPFFGQALRQILKQRGVRFNGKIRFEKLPKNTHRLLTHESRPLADILKDVNSWSNNLTAEILVLTLAKQNSKSANFKSGLKVIYRFAQEDLAWGPFELTNGSGLFGKTSVTPRQVAGLLSYMYQRETELPEYRSSFAISGLDGTLRRRLKDLKGVQVFAKTGTLDGVSGLSGYLVYASGSVIAFSILQNDFKGSARPIRHLQDEIIRRFVHTYTPAFTTDKK